MNGQQNPISGTLITTNVEIETSDNIFVNNAPAPQNKFNCYLTTVAGLMRKPVNDLNIEVSNIICGSGGETLENICKLYHTMGSKDMVYFDGSNQLKVYIKKNIKKGEKKK
jgi:hypothetical protein